MYRLTLYYLIGLVFLGCFFSFLGFLQYNPSDILIQTGIAVLVSFIANYIFAKIFGAITNIESVFITALILVLIIPIKYPLNAEFFALASVFAMGSKYLVTIEKRHTFNPAAAAIAAVALLSPEHTATWWIGTPIMVPFVLIGGLLLVRKIRREQMLFAFLSIYFLIITFASVYHTGSLGGIITIWQASILHSSLFFFMFVMLTEPLTSPPTKHLQKYYAYVVALLYATPQLRLFSFALTPELALCVGNIFSYIVSPKYRLALSLLEKRQLSPDTYAFIFSPVEKFTFIPGQYMEWTLPHKHTDNRGNRRYFSLASSPTEKNPTIEVRFYKPPSSFKQALLDMSQGEKVIAAQLSGDFVLPKNPKTPLVFIAGGVGVAPFRSMIKYISDKNLSYDIVMFYANRHAEDITFADEFSKAQQYGVRTIYTLTDQSAVPQTWQGERGYITKEMIQTYVPDYAQRIFYLSGPQLMVEGFETMLSTVGIKKKNIVVDYFPGYTEK